MPQIDGESDPPCIWNLFPTYHGRLAFDVGANGGVVARILAQHFDKVVAFEPCAESYALLKANHPANVVPSCTALSDQTGPLVLQVAETAIGVGELVTGNTLPSWGAPIGEREVLADTLDEMAEIYGQPDFVKIDTEGHEARVVAGGVRTLRHGPVMLIEVHDAHNTALIETLLPSVAFRQIRHPWYREGSDEWTNHFWLVTA